LIGSKKKTSIENEKIQFSEVKGDRSLDLPESAETTSLLKFVTDNKPLLVQPNLLLVPEKNDSDPADKAKNDAQSSPNPQTQSDPQSILLEKIYSKVLQMEDNQTSLIHEVKDIKTEIEVSDFD
jgi:hypothetical protein